MQLQTILFSVIVALVGISLASASTGGKFMLETLQLCCVYNYVCILCIVCSHIAFTAGN